MRVRAAVCVLAVMVASVAIAGASGAPAATNSVTLNLNCQSSTPIGTISTTQTIGFSATAPDQVQTGSSFDANIVFPADQVSSSQNGGAAHVDYIKNLSYKIPVPANARYVGGSLSGGFNYGPGTPTVTLQGSPTTGNVFYSIPGPIQTDQQFQIPALTLNLLPTGAQQSTISLQLAGTSVNDPGFTTTAHATSPFNGDAATACYEPPPKTLWTTTVIGGVDTTPPTITLNTPADGAQYPQGATVIANYACDDGQFGSGVATCAGTVASGSPIDTSTLGTFTFTVNATDVAGNAAAPVTHAYSVIAAGNDVTPPQITLATPPYGAVYQRAANVPANYSCLDNESGLATCSGDTANGAAIDTSTVGPHTFTVSATDNEGNPFSVEHAYRVVPASTQQNFTSGDVTNQIPVTCDQQFQTAHKTVPVTSNVAPALASAGSQFSWAVALGTDFIPSLYNGTNVIYKWKAPVNGHFVSAALTGAGTGVNGATIAVNTDGTLQLTIASITDQSTAGIGNDNFTPPPISAVIAVDGNPGTAVSTQFSEFDVTTSLVSLPVPTTSHCPAGDPNFNGRVNPTLTNTSVVDGVPPAITIASPIHGQSYPAGTPLTFSYSCTDNIGTPSCVGDVPNGTALDTSTSGTHQLSVTSVDAAGNTTKQWVTYTIADPTVTVGNATTLEGAGATLDFPVTLSNPSSKVVTVNYATSDGTAMAPGDYTATAGALTFNPGDPLTKIVSVPVVDDNVWKGDRTLNLSLVSAIRGTIGGAPAVGTIVEDDSPPVSVADARVAEGPGAQLDFAVSLAGAPRSPLTVDYQTGDGSATAPARYAATSGSLTFDPGGPLVQHVLVPVVNDTSYDETTIDNTQAMFLNAVEAGSATKAVGTGTIVDDEPVPPQVNIGSASIREGDTKTRLVKLTVTLTKPSAQTVTVNYSTPPGSASSTSDYVPKLGVLTFKPRQISKVVAVVVKGDTLPEGDESFGVLLSHQVSAVIGNAVGNVTILDDDHPTATRAEMTVSDVSVYEGGGGRPNSVTFTVSLNRPAGTPVSVQYAVQPGSAQSGSDFVVKTGTLSFTATAVMKTVTVSVKSEFVAEPDETFTLALSNEVGSATLTKPTGTATIINDD